MDILAWLKSPAPKFGTILSIDHPTTVEVAADSGFDWLWIDAEHGRFDPGSAATACAIAKGRLPAFIRVPDRSETTLKRYLDAGADGIIVPQVSSVADAREIARAALYPPLGQRSVGIARAQGYGRTFAETLRERNFATVVQIETVAGVENVQSIVQEPYVDAVIVGPYDLSGSCGVPGDIACAQVQDAIATVLDSCKRAGKSCGIFAAGPDTAKAYVQQGFDLVGVGIDAYLLQQAYASCRSALSELPISR